MKLNLYFTLQRWRTDVLGAISTKTMKCLNIYETVSLRGPLDFWCLLDPSAMAIALTGDTLVKDLRESRNDIILCGKFLMNPLNFQCLQN